MKLPLLRKEIDAILKAAPSVEDVMNTRHKTVKANDWKQKPPSKAAFLKAAVKENNLLRRPILLSRGKLVVGRDLEAISELLSG